MSNQTVAPDKLVNWPFTATGVAVNRGADFVKHLVPSRRARQNKALDPTALAVLSSFLCKIFLSQFLKEWQVLTHFPYRV